MGYKAMDDLKDIICRELEEIAEKGELSAGELDTVYKLIVSKEKLLRIEELEEDLGYSQDGEWNASGNYSRRNGGGYSREYRDNSMNGDSYGRHYVRGHYSRARGRYSMAEGKEMMADQIRDMLDDPGLSQADKAALKKAHEQLMR